MDHSIYGYLKRQDTYLLEKLLEDYKKLEYLAFYKQLVEMIQDILSERKRAGEQGFIAENQNADVC